MQQIGVVADLAQGCDALHGRALAVQNLCDVAAAKIRFVELSLRRGQRAEEDLHHKRQCMHPVAAAVASCVCTSLSMFAVDTDLIVSTAAL